MTRDAADLDRIARRPLAAALAIGVLACVLTLVLVAATPSTAVPVGTAVAEGDSMGNPHTEFVVYGPPLDGYDVDDVAVFKTEHGWLRHRLVDETSRGWMTRGDAELYRDQTAAGPGDPLGLVETSAIAGTPYIVISVPALWGLGLFGGLAVVCGMVYRRFGIEWRQPFGVLIMVGILISSVVLVGASSPLVLEGFEDGIPSSWEDPCGSLETKDNDVFYGSQSYNFTDCESGVYYVEPSLPSGQYDSVTYSIKITNAFPGNVQANWEYDGIASFDFNGGTLSVNDGSLTSLELDKYYRIRLTNIDYSAQTFGVEVENESGSVIASQTGYSFTGSASNIGSLYISGHGGSIYYIDHITANGWTEPTPTPTTDKYSQSLNVSDETRDDLFPLSRSTLYVDKWEDYNVRENEAGGSHVGGEASWTQVKSRDLPSDGELSVSLENDSLYRWRVTSPEGHYSVAGFRANESEWGDETYHLTIRSPEDIALTPTPTTGPTTAATGTPTRTPSVNATNQSIADNISVVVGDGGLTFTYDGEPVDGLNFSVNGPNGTTYEVDKDFADAKEFYQGTVNDTLTGAASEDPGDFNVSYAGTTSDGETFNGTTDLLESASGGGAGFGGPTGGGGGGGGGLSQVGGVALLAGGAYVAYRRFGPEGSLAERVPGLGGGR